MWFVIAKKEFVSATRDKTVYLLAAIVWVLSLAAITGGYKNYATAKAQREKAAALFRHEWEEQERNPHSAAHFGTWLFKPVTFLNIYDNGLNNYTGLTYRVEAHHRHEVNYSKAEEADSQLRFGELTIALVFQLLIPLLVLFLCFASVVREREDNTLRILLASGVRPPVILWGKVMGHYAILITILLPVFLLLTGCYVLFSHEPSTAPRMGLFLLIYLLYFFIITAAAVCISTVSKSSRASLLASLGCWVLLGILLPRTSAWLADRSKALPSRFDFDRQVQQGVANGIQQDGNSAERYEKFVKATLKKYGVDSVQQLPVNMAGLSMQFGEDYQAKVYDHYAGEIEGIIHYQQRQLETVAFADPFMAVQQLSMALTASDYDHHLAFHHQAQDYRDTFIRQLNQALAESNSASDAFRFTVGSSYFKKMQDFRYRLPAVSAALAWHSRSLVALGCWLVLVVLLVQLLSKSIYPH